MRKIFLPWIVILILNACGQPGDLPQAADPNPAGKGIYYGMPGYEQFRRIKIVCYIDTDKYNPLNARDYALKDSGLPFFDYVILGGAVLKADAKGYYVDFSDSFKTLLAQRKKYIEPLQNMGIKVLLGIRSVGSASFGHLNDDNMYIFSDVLYDTLKIYRLDGVEFFDDADDSAYPDISDYFDGKDGYENENAWLAEQWKKGGRYFNNAFFILRELFYKNAPQILPDETRRRIRNEPLLFVRECKYGRLLPNRFFVEEGYADFTASSVEITGSFNPFYDRFPVYSSLIIDENTALGDILDNINRTDNKKENSWMPAEQYGPLAIDLDGGIKRNILFPLMENADQFNGEGLDVSLSDLYMRFKEEGRWEYIFFNNLKSRSEAAEPYYKWVGYDSSKPPTEWDDIDSSSEWNPVYVPLDYVFNELTKELLNEEIACAGGNHVKDW